MKHLLILSHLATFHIHVFPAARIHIFSINKSISEGKFLICGWWWNLENSILNLTQFTTPGHELKFVSLRFFISFRHPGFVFIVVSSPRGLSPSFIPDAEVSHFFFKDFRLRVTGYGLNGLQATDCFRLQASGFRPQATGVELGTEFHVSPWEIEKIKSVIYTTSCVIWLL